MYHVRDDPETFILARKTLEAAYALAIDLVLKDRISVVVGEMTSEGFVQIVKLKYCELHVDLTPEEPS